MPQTPHLERHFTAGAIVRDIVIGMSDGLTVPFALAAGLSGAVTSSGIIVTAGLAEIAAGSIAMGLGGYLAAKGDAEHYATERAREQLEVREKPAEEATEVLEVLQSYGLTAEESVPIVEAFIRKPEAWVDFMMRFELGLEKPDPRRALASALTIAGACCSRGRPRGHFTPTRYPTRWLWRCRRPPRRPDHRSAPPGARCVSVRCP